VHDINNIKFIVNELLYSCEKLVGMFFNWFGILVRSVILVAKIVSFTYNNLVSRRFLCDL
jgi:hypothetical protein